MPMRHCIERIIFHVCGGGRYFRVYRSKKSQLMFPFLALISGIALGALVATFAHATAVSSAAYGSIIAQDDEGSSDEENIPTDQVDKYIAVYSAMQKNHSLSVEQAASKQGLTVDEFRTLEDKIERNPVVHERVLDALKASATGKKAASSSPSDNNED